jgi:hypothetical protein
MPTRLEWLGEQFYPDDLLPKMQQLLAILADLDHRYETDRYHLENWSGPQAIKAHLLADLERCHRTNRQRFETCLEELRLSARAHIEEMRRNREHLEPTPAMHAPH